MACGGTAKRLGLWLGLVQGVCPVDDPLRKYRGSLRGLALCDRPVIDPTGAFLSNVGVGEAVGLIAERVSQGYEVIAAFAHDI